MRGSHPRAPLTVAKWSAIFAINGALLFVVGVSAVRETYRDWQVDQQVLSLQQEITTLEGKKTQLTELASQLGSSDSIDREARLQLGLVKPGERVFVVRGIGAEMPSATPPSPEDTRSNPARWLARFFPLLSH